MSGAGRQIDDQPLFHGARQSSDGRSLPSHRPNRRPARYLRLSLSRGRVHRGSLLKSPLGGTTMHRISRALVAMLLLVGTVIWLPTATNRTGPLYEPATAALAADNG